MPHQNSLKYIFVSGGVVSGIGKGVTSSSLALLLKSHNLKVTTVKIDMYINIDAGTIRPQEHGEVFVTKDGEETDQDIGNYERFLNEDLTHENYITTGQIYQEVIRKERAFEYNGEDVEAIPHLTDEIIRRINLAAEKSNAEFVIVELGGTAGEIQNGLFFEANRILKLRFPDKVAHVHVVYLPYLANLGELKSKPAQTSVHILNSMGIQPDFLIARAEKEIDQKRLDRLALFCNMSPENIISAPNVKNIYEVPINLLNQKFSQKVLKKLGVEAGKPDLRNWESLLSKIKRAKRQVNIAVVGKYFSTGDYTLSDSYLSVVEALKHAAWFSDSEVNLSWIDSEIIEKEGTNSLKEYDGIVLPGGFGKRGTRGLIESVKFARENKVPYLGLCFGLQMAVVEYSRNVLGLGGANSTEIDEKTENPVVHIMPEQEKILLENDYGGTMRLGEWETKIKKGSLAEKCYLKVNIPGYPYIHKAEKDLTVSERHRHRYEVNNLYRKKLEDAGLTISGTTSDEKLVEIIELPNHPFFVGTQYHPELQSRPLRPHPLFLGFIDASFNKRIV